jgi:hypothetical protein
MSAPFCLPKLASSILWGHKQSVGNFSWMKETFQETGGFGFFLFFYSSIKMGTDAFFLEFRRDFSKMSGSSLHD